MPAPDVSAGIGPAVDPAPPTEAEPVASAAPGPPEAPTAAADIPVTGAGRGPAGRRPSLSGKGSPSGEVDARRDFIDSLLAQQSPVPDDAGPGPAALDSRAGNAEESAGSDL